MNIFIGIVKGLLNCYVIGYDIGYAVYVIWIWASKWGSDMRKDKKCLQPRFWFLDSEFINSLYFGSFVDFVIHILMTQCLDPKYRRLIESWHEKVN